MVYKIGNLLEQSGNIGITTNNIVKRNGDLVMGAGIAKGARDMHPSVANAFGTKVSNKHIVQYCITIDNKHLWSIPTKYHFKDPSSLILIEQSMIEIKRFLDNGIIDNIKLPLLGCNNGKLDWRRDVEPLAIKYFTGYDNVEFWSFKESDFGITNYKAYAGIGSRETPDNILELMTDIAIKLEELGYTLRSGGANGADSAFAKSVNRKEIFLPWRGFNGLVSKYVGATDKAMQIAKEIHPAWNRCSIGAKKLHARNIHQILGWDMNPDTYSKFVICWTPNAKEVGGTATAIKLAKMHNIKIYNLSNQSDLKEIMDLIQK